MRRTEPRTDYGTILLHWLLVGALATSAVTGLRFALDKHALSWLKPVDRIVPQGDLWALHIGAGLLVAAVAAAYIGYTRQARLTRRVRLDRARLLGLARRGRTRWAAINVLLYWLLFLALLAQVVTGCLMVAGHGGGVVTLHLTAAWLLLGFPVLHVAAHWAYGGAAQLLRVVRPARLEPAVEPPSLAETLSRHLAASERERQEQQTRATAAKPPLPEARLMVHPLAAALAAGLSAGVMMLSVDRATRDVLVVVKVPREMVPRLDGDLSDPAWRHALPVTINTNQGANLGGTGASRVEVRAVHDGVVAYLAYTWDDPTRSLKHLPLIKRPDGWHLLHTAYDIEDEDAYYEDKFAVLLARRGDLGGGGSAHLGPRPLPDKPGGLSGRGLHYTDDGSIVDVWHWKAARGGLLGIMDDNYFGPPAEPTPAELSGKSRYKAGYQTDPGRAFYANNFKSEPPGGYRGPLQPLRLPKDLAATQAAMSGLAPGEKGRGALRLDIDPGQGEADGARWWLLADESVPWSAAVDAAIPVGTVIPGVLISGEYSGDRADVRVAARWAAGRWTLEVARLLDTGSRFDVAIASGVFMWVAVFDHTQTRHTRHLRPVRLEVK